MPAISARFMLAYSNEHAAVAILYNAMLKLYF